MLQGKKEAKSLWMILSRGQMRKCIRIKKKEEIKKDDKSKIICEIPALLLYGEYDIKVIKESMLICKMCFKSW